MKKPTIKKNETGITSRMYLHLGWVQKPRQTFPCLNPCANPTLNPNSQSFCATRKLTFLPSKTKTSFLDASKIPESRRRELVDEIIQVYQLTSEPTEDFLQDLATRPMLQDYPGEVVVNYYSQNGRTVYDLQQLWRQHFIDSMRPRFLPKHWSVHYRNRP